MQEPHTIAFYLFTDSLDSLDLRATEAAMAAADFEVTLSRHDSRNALEVVWQPDPIVHPEYQAGGILDKPPVERHTLRFDAGELAKQIRRDVSALLGEEEQTLPEALKADGLVHLMELETAKTPRHRLAMLYALLAELAATAIRPRQVLIYDPGSALSLAPENVRELMDWRDLLAQLDNPLDIGTSGRVEDPDFAPSGTPAPSPPAPPHSPSPGAQQPSQTWAWLLAGLASLGLIAWFWLSA